MRLKHFALLLLLALGYADAQTVTVSGSHLGGPNPVTGTITLQPALTDSTPASARVGGAAGGITARQPLTTRVVNGAFSLAGVLDTSASSPTGLCYSVTARTTTGLQVLGPGFSCVQPAANNAWCSNGGCNFDLYSPNTTPTAPVIQGVQGIQGVKGDAGCQVGSTCVPLGGVLVNQFPTLTAAAAACPADGSVCDLVTYSPFVVCNTLTLPAQAVVRFVGPGSWVCPAAPPTITIPSGKVVAPAGQQYFNNVAVAGLTDAWADWFGYYITTGDPYYPAGTLAAVYAATVPGATIRMSARNYRSTTDGRFSPRRWVGAGRPAPDTIHSTTRFVTGTGTVIQGAFINVAGDTYVGHLGVDDGTWVRANVLGGTSQSFALAQTLSSPTAGTNPVHGVVWEDLATVQAPAPLQHSMLFENVDGGSAKGMYIYLPGAGYGNTGLGFISKSQNSHYTDIFVYGATDFGAYDKSNCCNGGGHASNNIWTNIHLRSNVIGGHDAGRFIVEGNGDSNVNGQVHGLYCDDDTACVTDAIYNTGGYVGQWLFDGVYGTNMYGPCVFLNNADRFVFNYVKCENFSTTSNTNGNVFLGAGTTNTYMRDVTVGAIGSGNPYGIINQSSTNHFEHVIAINTNYTVFSYSGVTTLIHDLTVYGATAGTAPNYTFGTVTVTPF